MGVDFFPRRLPEDVSPPEETAEGSKNLQQTMLDEIRIAGENGDHARARMLTMKLERLRQLREGVDEAA